MIFNLQYLQGNMKSKDRDLEEMKEELKQGRIEINKTTDQNDGLKVRNYTMGAFLVVYQSFPVDWRWSIVLISNFIPLTFFILEVFTLHLGRDIALIMVQICHKEFILLLLSPYTR